MGLDGVRRTLGSRGAAALGLAVGTSAVVIAVAGPSGDLSRDESVYAYGGQQLADGVPPYVSIFDPKGPLAMGLAGLGAALARLVGVSDLFGIRAVFALSALVAVAGVFCLTRVLFDSLSGALVAGLTFATYEGWVRDALSGPDAKTPLIALLVWCLFFAHQRSWLAAGALAALACSAWQPAVLPLLAMFVALVLVQPSGARLRPAARITLGAGVVGAVFLVWLSLAGALAEMVEATVEFPLTGIQHANQSIGDRLHAISDAVTRFYGVGGVFIVVGVLALVVLLVRSTAARRRHRSESDARLVALIAPTFILSLAYSFYDFQGYPDALVLLPFASIGIGGAVASLHGRSARPRLILTAAGVVLAAALVVSTVRYAATPERDDALGPQTSAGCVLAQLATSDGDLWAIGDPTPLVLTGLTNPDRYVYISSGVADWKVAHLTGGLPAWRADLLRQAPSVVVIMGVNADNRYATSFTKHLRNHGYVSRFLGAWPVLVTEEVARERQSQLTTSPTRLARDRDGTAITSC